MSNIRRRIEQLEQSSSSKGDLCVGLADRIDATFRELEAEEKRDPEGYRQRRLAFASQVIAETEADLREGRHVSSLDLRIADMYRGFLHDAESVS